MLGLHGGSSWQHTLKLPNQKDSSPSTCKIAHNNRFHTLARMIRKDRPSKGSYQLPKSCCFCCYTQLTTRVTSSVLLLNSIGNQMLTNMIGAIDSKLLRPGAKRLTTKCKYAADEHSTTTTA